MALRRAPSFIQPPIWSSRGESRLLRHISPSVSTNFLPPECAISSAHARGRVVHLHARHATSEMPQHSVSKASGNRHDKLPRAAEPCDERSDKTAPPDRHGIACTAACQATVSRKAEHEAPSTAVKGARRRRLGPTRRRRSAIMPKPNARPNLVPFPRTRHHARTAEVGIIPTASRQAAAADSATEHNTQQPACETTER